MRDGTMLRAGIHFMAASAFVGGPAVSVLIIEDDADTAESLARFLRLGCGYTVATAADGQKGPHGGGRPAGCRGL